MVPDKKKKKKERSKKRRVNCTNSGSCANGQFDSRISAYF